MSCNNSLRIVFTLAALNSLDVLASDEGTKWLKLCEMKDSAVCLADPDVWMYPLGESQMETSTENRHSSM